MADWQYIIYYTFMYLLNATIYAMETTFQIEIVNWKLRRFEADRWMLTMPSVFLHIAIYPSLLSTVRWFMLLTVDFAARQFDETRLASQPI